MLNIHIFIIIFLVIFALDFFPQFSNESHIIIIIAMWIFCTFANLVVVYWDGETM